MPFDLHRAIEHVHGQAGWLSAALLIHPAIALRSRTRNVGLTVLLSTALATLTSASGAWLYVGYRESLKRDIFQHARSVGLLFERKEHLAFAALMLAWAGVIAYFTSTRAASIGIRNSLRTMAFRSFACSAVLAVLTAIFGTWVGIYRSF
ncbi:MAG: hypothetical protein FWD73_17430 [Polyangiaceae bacterium]|nr:hypothetical protein [Polyangiaceae bacterium]